MLFAAVIRVGDQRVDENAALGCTNQRALHFAAIESENEDFDAGLRPVDRPDEWCHTIARLHEQLHVLGNARGSPISVTRQSGGGRALQRFMLKIPRRLALFIVLRALTLAGVGKARLKIANIARVLW